MQDSSSTSNRVKEPGIRALFTLESRWQAWLDVEAALARAQAKIGMVPEEAAQAITAAARLELLDPERIHEGFLRTAHTLVPLVWELGRVVGEPHGGWVHWGATTQNIVASGDLLLIRRALNIFRGQLREILGSMAALAERGAEMVMAGRTHGQHAVPITFGYKVATWVDELLRHLDRMDQAEPRIVAAMLGGAAGTFASFGPEGRRLQELLGKELNMPAQEIPSRAVGDRGAEYVCLLGMIAATSARIGREVYTLMKTEFGEVEEPVPPGTVGSSTMPQKRNPKLSQDVVSLAAEVRAFVPLALEAMQTEHEADRTTDVLMQTVEANASIAAGDMLARLVEIMAGLQLNPTRMRANLDLSGGMIMSEAIMLNLGKTLGRQHAHDVVYDAAQKAATSGGNFAEILAGDAAVKERLSSQQIADLLDPAGYTGLCAEMARDAARRVRQAAR